MRDKSECSNPFIFKTPVEGECFFGRDELLKKIFDYVNAGESVSLVGERRTGKTSVLLRLLDWKEQLLSQPGQHVLALLDFLGLDYRSEVDVWITLASCLLKEMARVGLETDTVEIAIARLQSGQLVFQTMLGLFRTLTKSKVKVTFLFDEFEDTVAGSNPVDLSFYKILRNLALDKETRLTYIIATRQELSEVERSLERKFTSLSSPLFNIFHQLVVPPFSEDEARQMVNGLLQSAGLDLAARLSFWLQRDLLLQLSGFHPFFLQIACYQVFEHCVLSDRTFSDQVPEAEIISAFLAEASSHFGYYWDISPAEEQSLLYQLATGLDVDIQSHRPTLTSLRNRCLVVRNGDAQSEWRLFSSSFARWIQERQLAAWYEEGMTQLATGEFQQAGRSFGRVYAIDPDYQDVRRRLEKAKRQLHLKKLYGQGEANLSNQQWQEAIEVFEELRKLEPRDGNIIIKLEEARRQFVLDDLYREGMEHVRRQRWRKASSAFENVVRLDPDYRDALAKLNIARGHLSRGKSVTEILRDPLWQGMGGIVAIIALIIAVSPFIKDNLSELVKPVPTPKPSELCNGAFESNFECWQHGGELGQSVECDGGECFAVLGNPDYKCEGGVPVGEAWIKQSFKVPETISPTLSLRYRVFSYDLDNLDFFQVNINGKPVGQYGNTVWDESDCSREVWDSSWRLAEFDLSLYREEMIEVSFRNVNGTDEWWNTWTYVDDVEIH
jgi:tetratricopeptide (TPR) repeat protein